ncbi:PHD finger protein 21B isoform X3 [Dromiciops gliroides]|uniref:PHD finger protein 21B isoform X3 n=1 Tax=Dromiciops gliroides TaxID=33562 RepID=UPI001CC79B60|nr:PHD finger protein 21B isoform X3 [Dromiciops gliroides]
MELQSLQEALKVGIQGHQNGDLKKQLVERHSRLPALSERQVRLAPAVLHSSAGPEALGTIAAVPIKVPQVSSLHRLAGQGPAALPQVRPKTLIPDSLPISPCRERPSKQAPAFQKATVVSIKNPSPALPTANNTGNQPVAEPAALTSPLSGAGVAYAIISTSPSNAASPIKPSSTTATATTVSMVSDSIKVQPLLISADNKVIIIQPQVQTQPDSKAETQKPPEELPQGVQASKKKKEAAPDVQESPEKIAFMVALGLVTAEHLEEIQSKRQERKRRSTANPAYSGLLETERKRLASNCLNSPLFLSTRANEESCWKNEISHEEVCVTCKRGTDLQPCGTCPGAYHLSCLDPPLKTAPKGVWVCPKCQEKVLNKDENVPWTGMLAIVHSYVTHKTVKEEEKRKLLKRGSELKSEHRQLEEKDRLLNSAVKKCLELKTSLLARRKGAQSSLERLRTLLRLIQNEQMLQVTMTTTTASASPLLAVPWIKPAAASATVAMHTALPQAQGNN